MKKTFASLLLSSVLVAQAFAGGWYTSGYGGWNQDDVISAKGVDSNGGYVIGGTIGKHVPAIPGLRVELDASYRQNEVDLFGFVSADHDTTALMMNAAYDFPVDWRIRPYALAGVGVARTQATFEDVALLRLEASGVAYQLGTGLNFTVADGVQAGVGYRYLQAPEISVLGTELSDGSNHSVVAQMTFTLD